MIVALRALLQAIVLGLALAAAAAGADLAALEEKADKHLAEGEWKPAHALYDAIVKEKADHPGALAGRGNCALMLRRYAEAKADLEQALKLEPDRADCRNPLAWIAFYYGDYRKARTLLRAARAEQEAGEAPDEVEKGLVFLLDGPFKRKFGKEAKKLSGRTKGGRYQLTTDLGAAPGKPIEGEHTPQWQAAADLLDRIYAEVYSKEFPFPKDESIVFNVIIFSRARDYKKLERILGEKPGSTAGLYSSDLKTLAVLDDEESSSGLIAGLHSATVDTIFHEGLHQFVDFYVESAPPWFDEGLGEFFGPTRIDGSGKFAIGGVSTARLDVIQEAIQGRGELKPVPVKEFLLLEQDPFVAEPAVEIHYAEAWALMHYLRSEESGRKTLQRYLDALKAGKDVKGAFEAAFAGVDLDALDAGYRKHVLGLRSE